jgi:hypothetical protein
MTPKGLFAQLTRCRIGDEELGEDRQLGVGDQRNREPPQSVQKLDRAGRLNAVSFRERHLYSGMQPAISFLFNTSGRTAPAALPIQRS